MIKKIQKLFRGIVLHFRQLKKDMIQQLLCDAWRKENAHNLTTLEFPRENVDCIHVGKGTYGPISAIIASPESHLYIGNYCSIASHVSFVVSADHPTNHISSYPFKTLSLRECAFEAISKGDIVVDDDVWIGYGATILSGVHIGQGAIIASGSVVTKDVEPYAIVGGIPAKLIRYRFPEEIREAFLQVDYSKLEEESIRSNIDKLYEPVSSAEQLTWLPKKQ